VCQKLRCEYLLRTYLFHYWCLFWYQTYHFRLFLCFICMYCTICHPYVTVTCLTIVFFSQPGWRAVTTMKFCQTRPDNSQNYHIWVGVTSNPFIRQPGDLWQTPNFILSEGPVMHDWWIDWNCTVYALYTIFQCEFSCNVIQRHILVIYDMVIAGLHFSFHIQLWLLLCYLETILWYGHHQASFFILHPAAMVIWRPYSCNIWYGHHQA